ncbi:MULTISPECIES: preprotein translocase subunit YajC [Paenibacillus]|jgi:preprotein translocase subunit YajC|uniref:Preprotein translocase yajc subunit n=1 Tax=Paenibacillus illinoisensis TaxID=59845 RepID=A0A2W0C1T2_9BACL|nr:MULTISPECIES: preprotein translocase subunit YajC [Paenibacillus]MBM6386223.1 preprotein translocase subunit YajC [Paenibacillus sp.]PAD31158.1 preprotein translocase subunit YajC [Paenibacillus sp. 7523-1]PYY25634.1 Preprotein translocase yajc subunit [Paenibacillus illinoisensis]
MFQGMPLTATQGGGIVSLIVPLVLMVAIFYFLMIRPQNKKQKQRNAMLNQLKKGDKIVTIGGLHGTIAEITDDVVVLRVNDVTKLTFDRNAISSAVSRETAVE